MSDMTGSARPARLSAPLRESRPTKQLDGVGAAEKVGTVPWLVLAIAIDAWLIATGSSYYLFILNSVLLAVIGASALNLLQGTVGQVSIGNAAFLAVGAYATVAAQRAGVPSPWDVLIAVAAGAVAGAVVGLPALRIRGFYLAFATLAAHFIIVQVVQSYQTAAVGESGFIVPTPFADQTIDEQLRTWAVVLTVVVAAVLVLVRTISTGRLGRAWRIIRDQEHIASTMGIKVAHYKMGAFTFSSGLIALQGSLYAHVSGYVSVDTFTLSLAISYVAMILVGGEDSQFGSVVGAVVVVTLPFVTSDTLDRLQLSSQYSAQIALLLYGSLIVVFVVTSWGGLGRGLQRLTARMAARVVSPWTARSTEK
jgi:branched-chain amino acid transport system permease protein